MPGKESPSPLISILIRPGRDSRGLAQTLTSLTNQGWTSWEAIVIEAVADAGEDDVLRSFRDSRIQRSATATASNACLAYNRALERCRGTYVGSLDAGDQLHCSRLALQAVELESRPELDLLGTAVATADRQVEELPGPTSAADRSRYAPARLDAWFAAPLHFSSLLVRRTVHARVGGLNPELTCAATTEFLARCFARGLAAEFLSGALTFLGTPEPDTKLGGAQRLVENAFIFSAHLAPVFLRAGRYDLFATALDAVAAQVGVAGEEWIQVVSALRLLTGWRQGFRAFSAAFGAACERWSAVEESASRMALPSRVNARRRAAATRRTVPRLVIVDDYFPNLDTAFRVAEFNDYLENFDCEVLSTYEDFSAAHQRYAEKYPDLADRVKRFSRQGLDGRTAAYLVFLHNAARHLADLEAARLPFAFTLYPGLEMYDLASDLALQRVVHSPLLYRVLATQHVTWDYVVQGELVDPGRAELIWGITVPSCLLELEEQPRRRYGKDKSTVDLCFTAHRYMPGGFDKGYDAFVQVARILADESPAFRFHVVGGMTPADIPLGDLASRFTFYPPQPSELFPSFYRQIDVILSPNRPFTRRAGGFDGFPTGCCVDAALCGVAVCCTDAFGENRYFVPGEEILIVPPKVTAIVEALRGLPELPEHFAAIGAAGRRRCRELYSVRSQLEPRRAILRGLLARGADGV